MSTHWLANRPPPRPAELPSRRRLIAATLLVPLVIIAVIVTAILPAEYGVDPTGLGEVFGLTEMGLFKVQADKEFAAMAAIAAQNAADSAAAANLPATPVEP